MAANNIIFYGESILNLSETTAVESDVAQGKIFYKANGMKAVGTGGSPTPPTPSQNPWFAVGPFNNWVADDSSYELIETNLEYVANNIDEIMASNLSHYEFDKIYFTHVPLGLECEYQGLEPIFEYNGEQYQCYTNINFMLESAQWQNYIPQNTVPIMVDSSQGAEATTVWMGTTPRMIALNGAGYYYLVLAENSATASYYISLKKYESVESPYGELIPLADIEVHDISLLTDGGDTTFFNKQSDVLYNAPNISLELTESFNFPWLWFHVNGVEDYSLRYFPNIQFAFNNFPNGDYSSYLEYQDGEFEIKQLFETNIEIQLTENSIEGWASSTITFTWLNDIEAQPEIRDVELFVWERGGQGDSYQVPLTLSSGSGFTQSTWSISNRSFSADDMFFVMANESWDLVGLRNWNNVVFTNFPNYNDYRVYLQEPQDPPFEDITKVLSPFVCSIEINIDTEQVASDMDLSSATITITYEGEN